MASDSSRSEEEEDILDVISTEMPRKKISGRVKTAFHNYFVYHEDTKKSNCKEKMCDKEGKKWEIKGKAPTNLRHHLQSKHPKLYAEFLKAEETAELNKEAFSSQNKSTAVKHQLTIKQVYHYPTTEL